MQFADYLVSYALQTLNRCLLKVAEDDPLKGKDERVFLDQITHLQSVWQMLQWSVGKVVHEQSADRLWEISSLIRIPSPELQAAAALLEFSHDKLQSTLLEIASAAKLPDPGAWPARRERLSVLLSEESSCWRDYLPLRQVPDAELVEHGMGRAYLKARRLSQRLDAAGGADQAAPGPKRLARTQRWIGHSANHLDLIRPALDDAARVQRWHLRRLHNKVEQQLGLELFVRRAVKYSMKPKQRLRFDTLIAQRRRHLDKQRRKLTAGAFALSSSDYVDQSARCVEKLGLGEITLLPLEA
jgi:hypothetical protein